MKNVLISIKGSQNTGDETDSVVEFITDGQYSFENGESVLTYMESELTGFEGTKTTLRVKNALVTLTREGSVNSQMVFQSGRKHLFVYDTPYGSATMGVDTHRMSLGLGEHGGNMEVDYGIDVDQVHISRNMFKINVREVTQ